MYIFIYKLTRLYFPFFIILNNNNNIHFHINAHELLFALSGYPGDVFKPYPQEPDTPKTFAIDDDFPLLHPTERIALNRLGHLGWIYSQLVLFVNQYTGLTYLNNSNNSNNNDSNNSIYIQTLATSLNTILSDYRSLIIKMEQGIVTKEYEASKGMVPLSYLTSTIGRWEIILPALYRLIEKVKSQQLLRQQECSLFDILLDQVRTGIPEVHDAIQKMIKDLNHVFYRQCMGWMIYGKLPLCPNDFFITEQQFNQEKDEEGEEKENKEMIKQHTEWQRRYQLVHRRIPKHISLPLAESVLYIGKAMATTNNNTLCMPTEMKQHHISLLQSLLQQQNADDSDDKKEDSDTQSLFFIFNSFEKIVQEIKKSTTEWLFSQVFHGDHKLSRYFTSFRQIFLLGDGELAIKWLELLSATKWNKSNNNGKEKNKGIQDTSITLRKRATMDQEKEEKEDDKEAAEENLFIFNSLKKREWLGLFIKASYGTDSEDKLDRYTFELSSLSTKTSLPLFLSGTLVYQLSWPIDLFLSDQDIQCYSLLWSLLISLKRVQLSLHHLFNSTSALSTVIIEDEINEDDQDDQDDIQEDEDLERAIWRLRSLMIFWIDTLWTHIQGNVITNHYEELMSTTSCPQIDFEKIHIAHQHFLLELIRGCFLSKSIKKSIDTKYIHLLNTALQICLSFCDFVKEKEKNETVRKKRKVKRKGGESSSRRSTNPVAVSIVSRLVNDYQQSKQVIDWMNQLIELENAFVLNSERLFGYLSNQQQDMKASGFISELLMKLDYNKWYSVVRYKSIPDEDEEEDDEE